MIRIVAIGGGEIGRSGYSVETTKIDKEIIALSGKKNPKILFIPTASRDSKVYVETFKKHFGKKLLCKVDVLLLLRQKMTKKQIEEKIMSTDIIYVGGGNTLKMMRLWKKLGVDKVLGKAMRSGKILSGLSAGAICWFKYGNSDSKKFINPKADYIRVSGLGFIPLFLCPHFDAESDRKPSLKGMIKKFGGIALALDNCAAIEIFDKRFRIITSKSMANAYKCFWQNKKYFSIKIPKLKNLTDIKYLKNKK